MTEFPTDQPAEHPTGFPVESAPAGRPDPETEPGTGGEPDFDSEPDRGALDSAVPGERTFAGPEAVAARADGTAESSRGAAHPLVEETIERLADLGDRRVAEHADVYADLQERLQSVLAEADRSDATERV